MAKKRQSGKKHKFKYAAPTSVAAPATVAPADAPMAASKPAPQKSKVLGRALPEAQRSFAYVGHDLGRIAVLAGALVALEAVLWWTFGHTGLGPAVYNLIHV